MKEKIKANSVFVEHLSSGSKDLESSGSCHQMKINAFLCSLNDRVEYLDIKCIENNDFIDTFIILRAKDPKDED